MKKFTEWILKDGGEGVVARLPESMYEGGKSNCMVKVKAGRDKEAMVVGTEAGSYILQLPSGITFKSGIKNLGLAGLPQIGDVVSFSYETISRIGEPVHSLITRVRNDVDWEVVLYNAQNNSVQPRTLNNVTAHVFAHGTSKPHGFWTIERGKNIRAFFDNFAAKRKRDAKDPHGWYTVTASEILATEGGRSVLSHYGDSVSAAIKDVYPDISLEDSLFGQLPVPILEKVTFEEIATRRGFDPNDPQKWYSLSQQDIINEVGGSEYLGKFVKNLMHAYPELQWDEQQFSVLPRKYWWKNKRSFLERFAAARGFDTLDPEAWYSVTKAMLLGERAGTQVIGDLSISSILAEAFPEIKFDESKFSLLPRYFFLEQQNRVSFFSEFASIREFDHKNPENWYSITREDILKEKGGSTILSQYGGSMISALIDTFPSVPFEKLKFVNIPKSYWNNVQNRRSFFEAFARKHGFAPSDTTRWRDFTKQDILQEKGGSTIMTRAKGSITAALKDAFGT